MSKEANSRRAFFKKVAAVAGVVASADYTSRLIFGASAKTGMENKNNETDAIIQEKLLSQKQFVLMTDIEKKQRLDEILDNYYKNIA